MFISLTVCNAQEGSGVRGRRSHRSPTSSNFTGSSLNGTYAFFMDGLDSGGTKERVGTMNWNGNSTLKMGEAAFSFGAGSTSSLSGTYSVNANGRVVGSLNGLSNNLVFYLISSSDAYILQNDTGVEIQGVMSKQP
jgi:hypothetical protein